jgi:transcriptional regulator with XRE-family HTH domain
MSPHQFKAWRKALGLKQKEAAARLGLKKRVIQYYERGHRDGKNVDVPKAVELACYALASGVEEYDGGKVGRRSQARRRLVS